MKRIVKVLNPFLLVFIAVALFTGCENKYPNSIYSPNAKYNPDPVITDVQPKLALAGIDTVKIMGKNFSPNPEENTVYFNGKKAVIISASETELTVQAPNVPSDSVKIDVAVHGALLFAKYAPIKLEYASIEYGGFDDYMNASGLACDLSENIYVVLTTRKVLKVTPDGTQEDYGTVPFFIATGMKIGPGGYLYILRGNRTVYRIPPGGGAAQKFVPRISGRIYDLDFGPNGILYTAGKADSIFSVQPDGSFLGTAAYVDYSIKSVRVYDGYVYVAGEYNGTDTTIPKEGVWRNQITSTDGKLGNSELVFDWAAYAGENGPSILSITFSEKGNLYIGENRDNAITIYSPGTGSTRILYPGVIFPPTNYLSWGNGNYLYANRHNDMNASERRIMRYTMKVNGAPYYGRK